MKFMRSKMLMETYRRLHRRLDEYIGIAPNEPQQLNHPDILVRTKRSNAVQHLNGPKRYVNVPNKRWRSNRVNSHKRVSRTLSDVIYRQLREPFQADEAYAKYMAKIKQKYQKYVKNILGYNNIRNYSSEGNSNHQHYNNHQESLFRAPTEPTFMLNTNHNHHTNEVESLKTIVLRQDVPKNYNNEMHLPKKQLLHNNFNYRPNKKQQNTRTAANSSERKEEFNLPFENRFKIINNNYLSNVDYKGQASVNHTHKPNLTDIIAKLNEQIVRKKRYGLLDKRAIRYKRDTGDDAESNSGPGANADLLKRGKPKSPCEVSLIILSVFYDLICVCT